MSMASASTPARALTQAAHDDDELRLAQLRADIQAADDQWERGETIEGDEFLDELLRTFHQRHPHATE